MAVGRTRKRDGLRGSCETRTELARLHRCALSQLATGDSGRKPEVVLDPARCSGLTAGGDRLYPLDIEAFRSRVERRGEARRPSADDDHIA